MSPAGTACSYEVKEFSFSVVSAAVSPADCLQCECAQTAERSGCVPGQSGRKSTEILLTLQHVLLLQILSEHFLFARRSHVFLKPVIVTRSGEKLTRSTNTQQQA